MARYIDENTAWHYIKLAMPLKEREKLLEAFKKIPTADVQEVRHGKWVEDNDGVTRCSRCGSKANRNYYVNVQELSKFCHMCGAKMDGKD